MFISFQKQIKNTFFCITNMIFSTNTIVLNSKLFFKFILKARRPGRWTIEFNVSLDYIVRPCLRILLKRKNSKGKQEF